MKKSFQLTALFAIMAAGMLINVTSYAGNSTKQKQADSLACLEVSGKVTIPGYADRSGFTVKLYQGNELIDSLVIGLNKAFRFLLEKNSSYTVKISRKGFITRAIWFDTALPEDVEHDPVFRFHFDTLLEKQEKVNKRNADVLDFPIALVYYDEEKGFFDYSRKYTSKIKTLLAGSGQE